MPATGPNVPAPIFPTFGPLMMIASFGAMIGGCSMLVAMSLMRSEAAAICSAWWLEASASCSAVAWVSCEDAATCTEVSLMVATRWRSSSTA